MKPYLPYARVSSDEQKDAETIKTQIAEVERWAQSNSVSLSDWILDDGVSGMIPLHEREGGARLLESLRSNNYAGLICLNHKRLGRDAYVIHLAVKQVEQELGLDILAIREPVPSQLAPGARALMRAMYAGVAQYDREELLAAMRAGKIRAAKEGRWSGGKIPYGCTLKTEKLGLRTVKRLIPDEERKHTVVEIFTLYSNGKTQAEIASILNARGVPHPDDRIKGIEWHQSTISVILRNPVYKGEGQWRRRHQKGKSKPNSPPSEIIHYEDYNPPAIVSPALWDRCAELRKQNTLMASRNARRVYLLKRLVYCGLCGKSYTGSGGHGGFYYYQCTSRVTTRYEKHCGNVMTRADHLEGEVLKEVTSLIHAPDALLTEIVGALSTPDETRDDSGRLSRLLAQKQLEKDRVIAWGRQGRITEGEMDAQLLMLRGEIEALEGERERVEREKRNAASARERLRTAEEFLYNLARRVDELPPAEMGEVLRHFVSRILITPRTDERGKRRPHAEMFLTLSPPLHNWNDPASSNCFV
ncbi:MAG TPA: recombinase family protein [Pyrinomonadaceae bacterium]|jgi:site-specific DNA recombinase